MEGWGTEDRLFIVKVPLLGFPIAYLLHEQSMRAFSCIVVLKNLLHTSSLISYIHKAQTSENMR